MPYRLLVINAMGLLISGRFWRYLGLSIALGMLSGCLYWLHAYRAYLQMSEFDRYFSVNVGESFTLHFKEPTLYSDDFLALSKLYPSDNQAVGQGRRWRYWFRKIDQNQKIIQPEVRFYSDMLFNADQQLTDWSFSALFLQIAPPAFLEVSLRSIGGAAIDETKKQLQANSGQVEKIDAELPDKAHIVAHLGAPIAIRDESDHEVYEYRFLLDTPRIEQGYESNAVNEVKLSFDKKNQQLFNMAGNFAGLKVSIDYRKFLKTVQK